MRVQLFNDKQVSKLVDSVHRQFTIPFDQAKEELEALLDAEIKRQAETNPGIQEYLEERKVDLAIVLKLVELQKQVEAIDEDYQVRASYPRTSIHGFKQSEYDENTQNQVTMRAKKAAKLALGLNDMSYRMECLLNDITARVAVMAVVDYDTVVVNLNSQITIKDYFVTL